MGSDPNKKAEAKHRAFLLALEVIRFIETLDRKRSSLWVICDQLIRSATSIGANITEARGSLSKREFARYLRIALRSANETKYWLALMKELVPEHAEQIDEFLAEADELSKILGSSVMTLNKNKE